MTVVICQEAGSYAQPDPKPGLLRLKLSDDDFSDSGNTTILSRLDGKVALFISL